MLDQLDRLIEVANLPVSLGIIPFHQRPGRAQSDSFWIFDESLVQVETLTTGLDITRPAGALRLVRHETPSTPYALVAPRALR